MGIAPVEPQESVRFKEVIQTSKMLRTRLHTARNHRSFPKTLLQRQLGLGSFMEDMVGFFARMCGEDDVPSSATRRSGEGLGPSSSNMTDPPHFLSSTFCKENEIFQQEGPKKEVKNDHFLESIKGPIMLCNMLGPIFDSTLDQFLTQEFDIFAVFKVLSAKFWILKQGQAKNNKLCNINFLCWDHFSNGIKAKNPASSFALPRSTNQVCLR